ncbi:unnamed protein product [Rangifer tarandus platyrhynchus]|uniref:Uncharacterized protein n=2 Tax=Rangifer tarandus platyrhynchus TaxID=3082113 RepID=A0ACB0E2X0_RANTA|nr:unnamed protein product [Rangifer tarandus platyrhynchus]CAI9694842.1 unnamed protein product [Rangifer tarandus platyrhynchus]
MPDPEDPTRRRAAEPVPAAAEPAPGAWDCTCQDFALQPLKPRSPGACAPQPEERTRHSRGGARSPLREEKPRTDEDQHRENEIDKKF